MWPGSDSDSVDVGKVNNFLVSSCAATAHLSPAPPGPVLEAGSGCGGGGGGGGGGWLAAWPASVLIVGSTAQQPPGVWSSWSGAVASSAVQTLSVSTSPPPPPAPQWTEDSGHQHPPPLTSEKRSERDGQSDNLQRKSSGSSWSILR